VRCRNGPEAPRDRDFGPGASFRLDEESSDSEADDDNLLQRGTFASPGRLELELGHRVPSCRGVGTDGADWEAVVEAEEAVDPDVWTRSPVGATAARCGSP
jgi:hypothetical protein